MNRWLALSLVILCWMAAGFVLFGLPDTQNDSGVTRNQVNRIVSLAPNLTEILFALGLEDRIVGVTSDSDYPSAAEKKRKVGTFWQPDIEAVIGAKPDLVIALGFDQQTSFAERLKRTGYNCLTLDIDKVGELLEAIEKIGAAIGEQNLAGELASEIQGKFHEFSALVGGNDRVRVKWYVQK